MPAAPHDPSSPSAPRSPPSSSGANPPEPPLTLLHPTTSPQSHSTTFPTDSSTSRPRRRASSASHHSPPEGFRALPRHANPVNPPEPPLTLLLPATSRLSPTRESHDRRDQELSHGGAGQLEHANANTRRRSWYASLVAGVGSGMWNDIKGRAPWYLSDWTDAWNYRVIPSTWVGPGPSCPWLSAMRTLKSERVGRTEHTR